jgi:hypothetical protein
VADHGPHSRHDRFAIASAVGGGAAPVTIRSCPACGALYADLSDLRFAIRHAWTPRRVRDLRLSAADGARLRPRGLRAALAWIGSARDRSTRPLAVGFTALGLIGVLLTSAPIVSFGSSAAASSEAGSGAGIMSAPEHAAPSTAASGPGAAPSVPARGPAAVPSSDASAGSIADARTSLPDRSSGTLLLSVGFLTLGLGLFGLRRSGRRGAVR